MNMLSLNGSWMGTLPGGNPMPMEVPGCFDRYTEKKDIASPVIFEKAFALEKKPGRHYRLRFGAVSYYCDVFVNGLPVGSHEGMWDPFMLDATAALKNGENLLRVEVTKPGYRDGDRFPLRQVLSGFIPDVLYTFGGLWDDVALLESESFFIDHCCSRGEADGRFCLSVELENAEAVKRPLTLELSVTDEDGREVFVRKQQYPAGSETLAMEGRLDSPRCWSPGDPYLYACAVTVRCGGEVQSITRSLGLRSLKAEEHRILLNGEQIYLRGALHWGCYDETIIPNPDGATIEKELGWLRTLGMNAVKHCLYIPREGYLSACDRAGVLQWVELPLWLPEPSPQLPERIRREYPRIIKELAGHPSIILTTLGCELDDKVESDLLKEMYDLLKAGTDTLVRDNSGSGECYGGPSAEYADYFDYHFYADLNYFENLLENFTPGWRNTKPWLFGEFCDADVIRNLSDVRRAKGVERLQWEPWDEEKNPLCVLKPDFRNHLHDERMSKNGLAENFADIRQKSVNHAMVHRKATLEMTRAVPVIGGYNLTTFYDVPLCPNGLIDDMGASKYRPELLCQSNANVVLVPAWDLGRVWVTADRVQCRERYNFFGGESYGLHVLLSNFSGKSLAPDRLRYRLTAGDRTVLEGELEAENSFPNGEVRRLATLRITLPEVADPATLVLWAEADLGGRTVSNQWPVFVYPAQAEPAMTLGVYDCASAFTTLEQLYATAAIEDNKPLPRCDAVLTGRLTPAILDYAEQGGRVVLMQRGQGSLPVRVCSFWREGMLWRGYPSFLDRLPYESWMDDLRFYSLSTDTAFDFERFDLSLLSGYRPLLRRYDCREWLAQDYLARIQLGKGSIYATTLRLEGGAGKQPGYIVSNPLGRWLLREMLTAE